MFNTKFYTLKSWLIASKTITVLVGCVGYCFDYDRAQVMKTFFNESPSKIRQGTVLHFRVNSLFAQIDKDNCVDFYNSDFPGKAKLCLGFMSFRPPSSAL